MPAVVVEKTVLLVEVGATLVDVRTPHPAPPHTYDPLNYAPAQAFGAAMRQQQAFGIVYDSVRDTPHGTCVAIFRPPALMPPVRVHQTLEYHWGGHVITVR